jgi:hypothetical protein
MRAAVKRLIGCHYWAPFTGARMGKLALLRHLSLRKMLLPVLLITDAEEDNKRLKTATSRCAVPVHRVLISLGFLEYITEDAKAREKSALLFHLHEPGTNGRLGETWSKWFGRYVRANGITSRTQSSSRVQAWI